MDLNLNELRRRNGVFFCYILDNGRLAWRQKWNWGLFNEFKKINYILNIYNTG